MERPQRECFGDLQQAERRRNVACNIDRECIGKPLLQKANRYFDGLGSGDNLGNQVIGLGLGHVIASDLSGMRPMNSEADSTEVDVDRFQPQWDGEDAVSSETSTH